MVEGFETLNASFMLIWDDNVMKFCGEQVVSHFWQLSDNLNFSEYFFALVEAVKNILNQLNGEGLPGLNMLCSHNLSEASFSEEFQNLVLIRDIAPNGWQVNLVGPFHD